MEKNVAETALEALRSRSLTLATAESCTGGLVAKLITDVAGASDVFEGGVVSYSNKVKAAALGVSTETLEKYGAVSENTAREMAKGATGRLGADVAVSTTGIAGPGGGTREKPVGTVCFGVASPLGVRSEICHFDPTLTRDEIRHLSAEHALELVIAECGNIGE